MSSPVESMLPLPWPRTRLVLAWMLALFAAGVAFDHAWRSAFADSRRNDKNSGHASIDFGGQWLMGRMFVEGQGHHLYYRPTLQTVLDRAYPSADDDPKSDIADAGRLMAWLAQGDGKIGPETLGGALYPPVQGLLFAPFGTLSPRVAYRVVQTINLLLVFAVGWLAESLSKGRVWWPVASFFLMLLPGFAGALNLGQNSMFSLALLTFGWWNMVRGRPVCGGVVWGFLAFKPVWAVAFFPVTLLTGRWRMAAAMAATGLLLIAATLPLVGVQTWFDWVAVGRLASRGYATNDSWIFLSRDLQGAVRRGFMAEPDAEVPTLLALYAWLAAAVISMGVALACRRAVSANDGPGAAFLLLGAWLSCFHFMYYDTLLVALPLLLLFTRPRGPKLVPAAAVVLLIGFHYGATLLDPSFHFAPFDTYIVLGLWGWCGWQILRRPESADARVEMAVKKGETSGTAFAARG